MAEMRVELTHTEVAAKRIQNQLEAGVAEWQKAQTDFMTQRDRLVERVTSRSGMGTRNRNGSALS